MPKNFARKTFNRWIRKNQYRFKFPAYISKSRKDYFVLRFYGLVPELTCHINNHGIADVWIRDRQGQNRDIIMEFDVCVRRMPSGQYYCEQCINKTYYPTRQALWEEHVFEALLLWLNKFSSDSQIGFYGKPDEYCAAKLFDKDSIKFKEDYEGFFNVIVK